MILERTQYSLDDLTLLPAKITSINSRTECYRYYNDGYFPLFTAPMSCVISEDNWQTFDEAGIKTIIPRSVNFEKRIELAEQTFAAISLAEFEFIIEKLDISQPKRFLIDIANGHMQRLYDLCRQAHDKFAPRLSLMVGNIANPETYRYIINEMSYGCIDYVRLSIGSGSCCTTSANSAIHMPMASLIDECNTIRRHSCKRAPQIIADGGFRNFDQIIKALALGADYVMLGNIFARTKESCGEYVLNDFGNIIHQDGKPLKYYYGMSTRKAQKEFGGEGNKTAEGIIKTVTEDYTLSQWIDNFNSYLASAMSYTNCRTLYDFIGNTSHVFCPITPIGRMSYFK